MNERIALLGFVEFIESQIDLSTVRQLYRDLFITNDEVEEMNVVNLSGLTNWDGELDFGKEIHFPKHIFLMIRDILTELSNAENLCEDHVKLYELFCGDK